MSDQPQENSQSGKLQMAPELQTLQFLLGEWQAISGPGEAKGGFSFLPQLQSRVIVRTNYAEYPASSDRPAYRHDDLIRIQLFLPVSQVRLELAFA